MLDNLAVLVEPFPPRQICRRVPLWLAARDPLSDVSAPWQGEWHGHGARSCCGGSVGRHRPGVVVAGGRTGGRHVTPPPARHVGDRERRSRLAVRHALHRSHRVGDTVAATRAMTVLHATEAASVYLAVRARTDGVGPDDVDRALYTDRSVLRQLAMRRTLFVFPRELIPAALGSASARVAGEQRRLIVRDVEAHGVAVDGLAWLEAARAAVLARLAGIGAAVGAAVARGSGRADRHRHVFPGEELRRRGSDRAAGAHPARRRGPDHARAQRRSLAPQPADLDADGGLARWAGRCRAPASEGYAELVRRWLSTFGPGTVADLQWWLGSTRTAVRAALKEVAAVEVSLDRGASGWLLPEDVDPIRDVEPWAALLPTLDPTTMGWRAREFYLDPRHTPYLFDTNGNAGNTAWWDGQIVGTWVQDDGHVRVVPAPGVDLTRDAVAALDAEAARLTTWLDGVRITNAYTSQLMKHQPLP